MVTLIISEIKEQNFKKVPALVSLVSNEIQPDPNIKAIMMQLENDFETAVVGHQLHTESKKE